MRLWHVDLLSRLPKAQLLGQHREACALRGKGWGRKHATVNYVFTHPIGQLVFYHQQVMAEMERRGYKVDSAWKNPSYRGKLLGYSTVEVIPARYKEHNQAYLLECIDNLARKNIHLG